MLGVKLYKMILSPNNNKKYREIVEVVFNWEMGMGPTSTMFTAYGSWDAQMGMGWWDMPMVFQWSGDEVRGLKKNISIWFAFRILVRFAYSGIYIIYWSVLYILLAIPIYEIYHDSTNVSPCCWICFHRHWQISCSICSISKDTPHFFDLG